MLNDIHNTKYCANRSTLKKKLVPNNFINKSKIYINQFLVLDLKIRANMKANMTAAAIPPAVASSPPVNAPKSPFALTAPIAPFARDAPNPIIGTFIPALAKEDIGSNIPNASSKTPIKTKVTKILAEVIFV